MTDIGENAPYCCLMTYGSVQCGRAKRASMFLRSVQHAVVYLTTQCLNSKKNKQTPWLLVQKRTIPTKRPPLVDEIRCQLLRIEGCLVLRASVPRGRYSQFSRREPLLFLSSISSFILKRLSGRLRRPTATQKIW
jgi:hypothetical protein